MRRNTSLQTERAGPVDSPLASSDLHDQAALDEALEESFPASDPVAVSVDPAVGSARGSTHAAGKGEAPAGQGQKSRAVATVVELDQVLALAGCMLQAHKLHDAIAVIGASAPTMKAEQIFVKVCKDNEACEAQFDLAGKPVSFDANAEALQLMLHALEAGFPSGAEIRAGGGDASPALLLSGADGGVSLVEPLDSHGYIAVHWTHRLNTGARESAVRLIQAFAVLTRAFLAGLDESAVQPGYAGARPRWTRAFNVRAGSCAPVRSGRLKRRNKPAVTY